MPILFGVALFVAFIALLFCGFWIVRRRNHDAGEAGAITLILLGVAALFTIFSSANTVPIRTIGIQTSFHKPTGSTTDSGLHFIKPWNQLRDWNASVQIIDQTGGGFNDSQTRCDRSILVRISTGATACVDVKVQWQVHRDANGKADAVASDQYSRYAGDFSRFSDNYVDTQLQNALNEVFSQYNPIAAFTGTADGIFDLSATQDKVKADLAARTEGQIDVLTVSIPIIHHDTATENQIKNAQNLRAVSRNLDQEKLNTDKQNAITQSKIAAKVSVQQQCIDEAVKLGISAGNCLQPGFPASGK